MLIVVSTTHCTQDQYTLRVVVTEVPNKKRSSGSSSTGGGSGGCNNSGGGGSSEEKKETKSYSDYLEALRDLQTAWITKLGKECDKVHVIIIIVIIRILFSLS